MPHIMEPSEVAEELIDLGMPSRHAVTLVFYALLIGTGATVQYNDAVFTNLGCGEWSRSS